METFIKAPMRFKFTLPLLTMAVTAAIMLAVIFTANPTWGQGPDSGTGTGPTGGTDGGSADDYPNLSEYPDPQPCGPGAGTAFMEEPHEIQTGHYALFDAYWRTIATSTSPEPGSETPGPGVGVLHTNLCPPEMIQTTTTVTSGRKTKTVTTTIRSARVGGMDIEEAIIHVLDTHTATTVASNAGAGQISLTEYVKLRQAVDQGDKVWWLRLDDPDTEADETSDLGMGFSTLLLDEEDWQTSTEPMRYRFEVERHPADPTDVPHFFAYEAPNASNAPQEPVWDSSQPGKGVVELDPGEYRALQWVFTKRGTYILWVHLLGDVRQGNPHNSGDPDYDDWNRISSNNTETSEVYRYTIQVGTPLDEIEPPIFGVNLEVEENSPGGVEVGDPIPIYNADANVLYYDLTGPGHSNFDLAKATSTHPHTVQVVVADGANLDYETTPSYDLHLSVTDKVDHEDNFNPYPDDVLIVRIDLKDQAQGLRIEADRRSARVGETVKFTAWYEPSPSREGQTPYFVWGEAFHPNDRSLWHVRGHGFGRSTWSVSEASATTKTYEAAVQWTNDITLQQLFVESNDIPIIWNP